MKLENFNSSFFILVLILVSAGALVLFWPFASAIFMAALLAVTFDGVYQWLVRVTRERVVLSAFAACLFVTIVIVLPIVGVAALVTDEAEELLGRAATVGSSEQLAMQRVVEKVTSLPLLETLPQDPSEFFANKEVTDNVKQVLTGAVDVAQKVYKGAVAFIIWLFVMFFSLFYFFIDGKRFLQKIMDVSPLRNTHEQTLIERFASMSRATLKGTVVIGTIQGLVGGAAMLVTGVASPLIWTVVMIVLSIIPAVGASIVLIPAGIIMLLLGNVWQGIVLIIVGVAVSFLDNLLRPKLVGEDTQMHPLLVFFATLGGIVVFGLMGFIIGPIVMALFLAMWEIYAMEFRTQLKEYNG